MVHGRFGMTERGCGNRELPDEPAAVLRCESYLPSKCAPMIAAIGFNFFATGSGSTTKFSSVVAPRRHSESFGPKITEQGVRLFQFGNSKLRFALETAFFPPIG